MINAWCIFKTLPSNSFHKRICCYLFYKVKNSLSLLCYCTSSTSWRSPLRVSYSHHYVWNQLTSSYSLIMCYKSPTIRQSYPFGYIQFYHCIVLFTPHCIELCHCFPKEYNNLNLSLKPLPLIFLLYFLLYFLFNFSLYFFLIIKVQ